LHVDPDSTVPIYEQIVECVRADVAAGRLTPGARLATVRALAAELRVHVNTVAHAYAELERSGVVSTRRGLGTFVAMPSSDSRLAAERDARLSGLLGKALLEALSVGYDLEQIEAGFALRVAQWRAERPPEPIVPEHSDRTIVAMGSHDLVVDLLAGHMRLRSPSVRMVSTHVGSLAGLMALARGECHLAGCHLLDPATGEYNLPEVRRVVPGEHVVLVNLAHRVQGMMVKRGNPKRIAEVTDLARPDVVFVNRQWGSGTRVLLDRRLIEAGIEPARVRGYAHELTTHTAVAAAVAGGSADVGVGILAAARSLDLEFIPLDRERYDLAILRRHYESELLRPLLDTMRDAAFQRVVTAMGGYDTALTGQVVEET
jgi:molybdate-binding protein/DNA-binding transcriptional regulator YhcF (GntR family)